MIHRVTDILRVFSSYQHVPSIILERAAARGTSVHSICAGISKGAWIPDGMIKEEYLGYVNSFKLWAEAQVDKFLVVEKRFIDDELEFSGQIDYVVLGKDGKVYLVDIKTTIRPVKTHLLQIAAYEYLLDKHSIHVNGAMLVYLSKEGEFPDITSKDCLRDELDVFMSALKCHKFFNKKSNGKTKSIPENLSDNE